MIVFGNTLYSQSSRSLPFLELNADTRTAGMGDANMGATKSMYLYTNPTAFFLNEDKIYTSYTFGMLPKVNDSRQLYHAVSAGYKFLNRHVAMVGFRYFSGLEVPRIDENGVPGKPIHPMDWAIDFAYAFQFNPNLSAFIGGNFIQSYNYKTAYTGGVSTGIYYNNSFALSNQEANYMVGLSIHDLGGKVKYGKKGTETNMPASVGVGGSLSLHLAENHKLNAGLTTRTFFLPSDAKAFTGGLGVEYELFDVAALRTGYHWGNDNGYFTVGLGGSIKFVRVDLAYSIAKMKEYNFLRLGVSVQL